jgi:rhodanese-related sulfurtransferase
VIPSGVLASNPIRRRPVVMGLVLIVGLACVGGALSARFHPHAPSFSEAVHDEGGLSLVEARSLRGAHWIDAREIRDFERGHVPGAILLNETRWEVLLPGFLEVWDPDKPIVVYCGNDACPAARNVRARLIRELGLDRARVFFLKGGLESWPDWNAGM